MKEKLKELQIKEIYTKGIKMNNMKVKQLSIFLQNKKGSLQDVLETLSENDINIRPLSLPETAHFRILIVVVDNPQK